MAALPQRIIGFGASTAFGVGDPEDGGFVGRLRRWYEPRVSGGRVYNLGIGGQNTTQMLERFRLEVPPRRPELVVLALGTNDLPRRAHAQSVEYDTYCSNVTHILTEAGQLSDVLWISPQPMDFHVTRVEPAMLEKYVQASTAIAASMDVPMIDLYHDMVTDRVADFLCDDGLHMNAVGHEYVFQRLTKWLTQSYDKS